MLPQVQNMFETVIAKFDHSGVDVPSANQAFLVEFKRELSKLTGVSIKSSSFEDTEKEYLSMLQPPKPQSVDFNAMKDEPLGDIERIIQEKQQQRSLDMENIFQKNQTEMPESPFNESFTTFKEKPAKNVVAGSAELMHILKAQNNVLTKILESQLKIIDLLQKI